MRFSICPVYCKSLHELSFRWLSIICLRRTWFWLFSVNLFVSGAFRLLRGAFVLAGSISPSVWCKTCFAFSCCPNTGFLTSCHTLRTSNIHLPVSSSLPSFPFVLVWHCKRFLWAQYHLATDETMAEDSEQIVKDGLWPVDRCLIHMDRPRSCTSESLRALWDGRLSSRRVSAWVTHPGLSWMSAYNHFGPAEPHGTPGFSLWLNPENVAVRVLRTLLGRSPYSGQHSSNILPAYEPVWPLRCRTPTFGEAAFGFYALCLLIWALTYL